MKKSVLLLNPPHQSIIIREYYCSKSSKTRYLLHPIDLLMVSGRLSENYEVKSIDAIARRMGPENCLALIKEIKPDVVVSLVGAISWESDLAFLEKVNHLLNSTIIVTGDLFLEDAQEWLAKYPFIDAALLDFTNEDILHFLEENDTNLQRIAYRRNGCVKIITSQEKPFSQFTVPPPRHDLFLEGKYLSPFARRSNFATVLTDFGCPYHCRFCIMGQLSYRQRPVDNVLKELSVLHTRGIKDIFFYDQSFGIRKRRNSEFCEMMIKKGFKFGWSCYGRVDSFDDDQLDLMKRAGCHTIIFGVESADDAILEKYRKGYTTEQIRQAFESCRNHRIRTVGTFILGLPEDDNNSFQRSLNFAKELNCDFVSYNIAVPRAGTPLRKQAIREGLIDEECFQMDQTGKTISMPTNALSTEQVQILKSKFIREYYLRPGYLFKRLFSVRSFFELKMQISEGISLFMGI